MEDSGNRQGRILKCVLALAKEDGIKISYTDYIIIYDELKDNFSDAADLAEAIYKKLMS